MKLKARLSLTIGACALALSANASAAGTWQNIPGLPKGHAAVASSDGSSSTVYFLNNTWVSQGWGLQKYDFQHPGNGIQNVGSFQGTSLAIDQGGTLWMILAGNTVREIDSSNWSAPPTACEGGSFSFRLEGGHNNIAVQNAAQTGLPLGPHAKIYVIDGNGGVRMWWDTVSCWLAMPALPSGFVANDISVKPNSERVWVADSNGAVSVLSGVTWQLLDHSNGHVKALGGRSGRLGSENVAVGFNNMDLYNWNDTTGWTYDPDWQHWQFLQFGTAYVSGSPTKFVDQVAIGLENTIWAKVQ